MVDGFNAQTHISRNCSSLHTGHYSFTTNQNTVFRPTWTCLTQPWQRIYFLLNPKSGKHSVCKSYYPHQVEAQTNVRAEVETFEFID